MYYIYHIPGKKIGQTRVMGRWHFDNCKHKIVK